MDYYFFKIENGVGHPIPGQVFEDGTPLGETINIKINPEEANFYTDGTVLASSKIVKRGASYGTLLFGDVYAVELPEGCGYLNKNQIPTPEVLKTFNLLLEKVTPSDKSEVQNSLLKTLISNDKFKVPTIKDDGFYVDSKKWYLLIRNLHRHVNTLLTGATGCGKTELLMLLCKKLGLKCHVYDMGSMYDPISGLLGVHRLDSKGHSMFDYAKFTHDIQEPGVIVLDELSRAPISTNNILFPCLDSRRELPVEIAGGMDLRRIPVNPDCTFVATANIGTEYTGTNMMDKALLNRFFNVELTYMPFDAEVAVLVKRTGIKGNDADMIVKVAQKIRNLYFKQELSSSVSTRETLMAAELVEDGYPLLDSLEYVYLPIFEGSDSEGERSIVRKLFASF